MQHYVLEIEIWILFGLIIFGAFLYVYDFHTGGKIFK